MPPRNRGLTQASFSSVFSSSPYSMATRLGIPIWPLLVTALLASVTTYWWLRKCRPTSSGAIPVVGFRSPLEPTFFVRVRYIWDAPSMIAEGYAKFKGSMFKIPRFNGDVVVVSPKYLDELQHMPEERLLGSGVVLNAGGPPSEVAVALENSIGSRALQTMPQEEEGWVEMEIQPLFLQLIFHMSQRFLVGPRLCRDQEWLAAMGEFADNLVRLQLVAAIVPSILRPILFMVHPWAWKHSAAVRRGRAIMQSEIQSRTHGGVEDDEAHRAKADDVLQGMIKLSSPEDVRNRPGVLGHRLMATSGVAGHSTAASAVQAFVDLVAKPDLAEELRAEVSTVLSNEGGIWKGSSVSKLMKLDSFLRESQGHTPAILLTCHRIVRDPAGITLHDGAHLACGTHLCLASHSISRDPANVRGPDAFDGLRYYRQRHESGADTMKHQHATADRNHLHFGYGRNSCPGRFVASCELKLLFAALLRGYEFAYPLGVAAPPRRKHVLEFPYLDPATSMMVRRRPQMT
ncbi:P450 monooxygenase [Apiospora saccharicola]